VSNTDPAPIAVQLEAQVHQAVDLLEARKAAIGDGTEVRRLLPQRVLRTIGAWCFLDHYGPDDTSAGAGMQVPPHPHIGLQTASWLFDGIVLHRDSLGSEQLIRPGELNLPQEHKDTDPDFSHYGDLPTITDGPAVVTVVAGEHAGERSPAKVYSRLAGLEVRFTDAGEISLPAAEGFEYGVLSADGPATVACPVLKTPVPIRPGRLAHLPAGVPEITLRAPGPSRFFIIGGIPFGEKLIMWWNFVARTAAEIGEAREAWQERASRFGEVRGYQGGPLAAPPLPPGGLKAR
jgi:quercetin 2,3-dioxygenase